MCESATKFLIWQVSLNTGWNVNNDTWCAFYVQENRQNSGSGSCLTCVYAFLSQIGEGDVSTGNMTGAHDLQLAPPGQPLSQATGTDTVFMTDKTYSPHLNISCFMYTVYTFHFPDTDQQKFHVKVKTNVSQNNYLHLIPIKTIFSSTKRGLNTVSKHSVGTCSIFVSFPPWMCAFYIKVLLLLSKLFATTLACRKPPLLCLHSAHCVLMCMNACMAGAPMLSRLLEAGPTQFSAPLGFMVSADSASIAPLSAATPVPVDSTASASTGLSTLTRIQTTQRSIHRLNLLTSLMPPALWLENLLAMSKI